MSGTSRLGKGLRMLQALKGKLLPLICKMCLLKFYVDIHRLMPLHILVRSEERRVGKECLEEGGRERNGGIVKLVIHIRKCCNEAAQCL